MSDWGGGRVDNRCGGRVDNRCGGRVDNRCGGRVDNWGTWHPDRPVELRHPPSGLVLTPVLYSARANRASPLNPGPGLVYGPRAIDGGRVEFTTCLEDTRLDWVYRLSGQRVEVGWRVIGNGEWGLRFWISWCVHGPSGSRFDYDRKQGVLTGVTPTGSRLTLRAAKAPLLVTAHDDLGALLQEFHERGYFYLASRATSGGFIALRFNLEEAPALCLAAAVDAPVERPAPPGEAAAACCVPPAQQSLQAVHDVLAWNHVYDAVNRRPYTVLTRNWNRQKFGGFGVWMNDVLYHALLWSLFDPAKARQNVEAVFAWQTPQGNFPCLVTGNDAWLDRSQPPIASFVVWSLAQRGDPALLSWAFPRLLRNHDWWWQRRCLADTGLVAYGTSLEVGDGLYKGTKLAAKDESMMDNSPVHDPAPYNPHTGLLEAADVGLNSLLALDGEILAAVARQLGDTATAARLAQRSDEHRRRIRDRLWDPQRRVFANRLLDGRFVDALAPTSFYPLAAGAADAEQTAALIDAYLTPADKFGGDIGLPSVSRDHPAYRDNVYWRGRVWAPLNFWVYHGLRRAGRVAEAAALAARGARLFHNGWRERLCGENYNADSGAVTDQPDSDPFYTWGALLPALAVSEVCQVTPWGGLSLAPSRAGRVFGPLQTPLGELRLSNGPAYWQVDLAGRPWLRGTLAGALERLTLAERTFAARLPATDKPTWLAFPGRTIAAAELDSRSLPAGAEVRIPPGGAPPGGAPPGGVGRQLRISLSPLDRSR